MQLWGDKHSFVFHVPFRSCFLIADDQSNSHLLVYKDANSKIIRKVGFLRLLLILNTEMDSCTSRKNLIIYR